VGDHAEVTECCRPGRLGRWCSAGSIFTALAAGVCCIGPLLFSVLGLSTFVSLWLLRFLVPYRNLFFAVTVLLLGVGFYTVYRRDGQAQARDQVILWASTLLVLAVLSYSLYVEGFGGFSSLW
jgi:mercuric ion transport protein